MPLFISDEELRGLMGDVGAVANRADAYITQLQLQVETQKARADAAQINAEQACAIVEQRYMALTAQLSQFEKEKSQLNSTLEKNAAELAELQAQTHKHKLEMMKLENDLDRASFELKEAHKAKSQLLEVLTQKDEELKEKNASNKAYLEKVVSLTEERSNLEAKIRGTDAELVRARANHARLVQEKELIEQHNLWLNEELSAKVNLLLVERHNKAEIESDLHLKWKEAEKLANEASEGLDRSQCQVKDLEAKVYQLQQELRFLKEDSAAKEDHLSTEIATASKLAELYKQGSEEWAKKANDLEGVIKALEVHLNQTEADYKRQLQSEVNAREALEKEALELKQNLEDKLVEAGIGASKSEKSLDFFTVDNIFLDKESAMELHGKEIALPKLPHGISDTALANVLLRDGWRIAEIYGKYQEAVDAWRHEKHERHRCQALLERVLHEIEDKAEVILEERDEHKRMVEAYRVMEEKLEYSIADQARLESSIRDLSAELKKKERALKGSQKEISDLQRQVAVLLKECSDIQHHPIDVDNGDVIHESDMAHADTSPSDAIISGRLLVFKDIESMVEHNTQLRALVRELANQNEERELEMKEKFDTELRKRIEEASQKVLSVLKRVEEQDNIIETLRGTVYMYKRLYEDEHTASLARSNMDFHPQAAEEPGRELRRLLDISKEEARKAQEVAATQVKALEEEILKLRHEVSNCRIECARADTEASVAREQLSSMMKESEAQRRQMEAVLLRNMELSQMVTDHQRKLREGSQTIQSAEEQSRRLTIEVSILEREKELLIAAEQRASNEVTHLSDRVHRLQATLDTLQNVEEAREASRAAEKKKLEDEVNHVNKEWADSRRELELERTHVRNLTVERDKAVAQAIERVEALNRELKSALEAASAFEVRAKVAEVRCTDLESSLRKAEERIMTVLAGGKYVEKSIPADIDSEVMSILQQTRAEMEMVKEELEAAKKHSEQYKRIAQDNEKALREMDNVYNKLKEETSHIKEKSQSEAEMLRKQLVDLEVQLYEKEKLAGSSIGEKDKEISNALKEISLLKDKEAEQLAMIEQAEEQIKALKAELAKQHDHWRHAQNNYERQVLLQADTIRELKLTSDRLETVQQQEAVYHGQAERAEAELESLKVSWAMEKASLQAEKEEIRKRFQELDEQNRVLLDRLEAKHITTAEQEQIAERPIFESKEQSEIQVIRYLRRAKETADTEVSLLKQERVRLLKQLEAALHASDEAQARLRREHGSVQASLYTDEEFKSLQAQVMEVNMLREMINQLREENKKLFEDSNKSQESVRKTENELEPLQRALREKEVDMEALRSEMEAQKAEVQRWQLRVSTLLEKYKAIDVEDYQKVKSQVEDLQNALKSSQDALVLARKEVEEFNTKLPRLEEELSAKDARVADYERKLQESVQSEATNKGEFEKLRKHCAYLKRTKEMLGRENEELKSKVEELNSSKKAAPEISRQELLAQSQLVSRLEQTQKETDLLLKEKDTRMQILEKTLEGFRDELRKEKAKRQKDQKTFYDLAQKAEQEKNKLLEEIQAVKQEIQVVKQDIQAFQEQGRPQPASFAEFLSKIEKTELDKRATSFQVAVDQVLEEVAARAPANEQQTERVVDELRGVVREKEASQKVQPRKPNRRIIRPRIEPTGPIEPSEVVPETGTGEVPEAELEVSEEAKVANNAATSSAIIPLPTETSTIGVQNQAAILSTSHKRLSSLSEAMKVDEPPDEVIAGDIAPPQKKPRSEEQNVTVTDAISLTLASMSATSEYTLDQQHEVIQTTSMVIEESLGKTDQIESQHFGSQITPESVTLNVATQSIEASVSVVDQVMSEHMKDSGTDIIEEAELAGTEDVNLASEYVLDQIEVPSLLPMQVDSMDLVSAPEADLVEMLTPGDENIINAGHLSETDFDVDIGSELLDDTEEGELPPEAKEESLSGEVPGPTSENDNLKDGTATTSDAKAIEIASFESNEGTTPINIQPGEVSIGSTVALSPPMEVALEQVERLPVDAVTAPASVSQAPKSRTMDLVERARARERAILQHSALSPPSPGARGGRGRGARGGKRSVATGRGGRVISTGIRGQERTNDQPNQGSNEPSKPGNTKEKDK